MDAPQTPKPDDWTAILIAWRVVGVFLGTLIAFVALWYQIKNRGDLIRRIIVSPIAGFIAGFPVREMVFKFPPTPPYIVLCFAICAIVAWPAIGVLHKLVENWKPKD